MKKMQKLTQGVMAISLITLLTGCADLNSKFDCPMKPGVTCKRVDQINDMVDRGEISADKSPSCQDGSCQQAVTKTNDERDQDVTPYPIPAANPGDPLRYGEAVMRIWIAPYEDTDGNYYQPTVMYHVVKPGHWIGMPVKETTNNT